MKKNGCNISSESIGKMVYDCMDEKIGKLLDIRVTQNKGTYLEIEIEKSLKKERILINASYLDGCGDWGYKMSLKKDEL